MEQAEWMIGLVTSFVVLIVILKSRANAVLRFLVQAVLGGILIYAMNQFFLSQNLVSIIALNPLTVLTCGFLGIPGVVLLFCIQILSML
ncbi:MAG: transcriptional regulator [Lachnospiraceae bacterium]|nr:transcriptional regulator [Lachnospiraceae bacterium]